MVGLLLRPRQENRKVFLSVGIGIISVSLGISFLSFYFISGSVEQNSPEGMGLTFGRDNYQEITAVRHELEIHPVSQFLSIETFIALFPGEGRVAISIPFYIEEEECRPFGGRLHEPEISLESSIRSLPGNGSIVIYTVRSTLNEQSYASISFICDYLIQPPLWSGLREVKTLVIPSGLGHEISKFEQGFGVQNDEKVTVSVHLPRSMAIGSLIPDPDSYRNVFAQGSDNHVFIWNPPDHKRSILVSWESGSSFFQALLFLGGLGTGLGLERLVESFLQRLAGRSSRRSEIQQSDRLSNTMTEQERPPEGNNHIEVFRQAGEFDRHYDRMGWTIGAIILPVSLGVIAFLAANPGTNIWILGTVGIFSIVVFGFWVWIIERLRQLQETRTRPIIIRFYEANYPDVPTNNRTWGTIWGTERGNWPYYVLLMFVAAWVIIFVIGLMGLQ